MPWMQFVGRRKMQDDIDCLRVELEVLRNKLSVAQQALSSMQSQQVSTIVQKAIMRDRQLLLEFLHANGEMAQRGWRFDYSGTNDSGDEPYYYVHVMQGDVSLGLSAGWDYVRACCEAFTEAVRFTEKMEQLTKQEKPA